jgi:hypothetical protein
MIQPPLPIFSRFHRDGSRFRSPFSHLSALCNDNVLRRLAFGVGYRPRVLDLGDHVHAFNHIAKDDVFAVQVRCAALRGDDEELTTVGVGTGQVSSCSLLLSFADAYPLFYVFLACEIDKVEQKSLTAIDSRPGLSCFNSKFSSANFSVP